MLKRKRRNVASCLFLVRLIFNILWPIIDFYKFNKEYSMKSKRALDISTLPPIENLKIGSFGYR